ncbi:unnamed protein product [Polarella glacialis]|uniref:Uncharacterized protein n=1 Tax=Polarella glacialis TaxID=89957 RepID=A0A813GWD7_POLGL|nr:unnamed protein product [Polarella glacialis]
MAKIEASAPGGAAIGETQRLVEALRAAIGQCDEAERRTSFGLYERWRAHLDIHVCAGGSVVSSDAIGGLDRDRGYVPAEEVARGRAREGEAARRQKETAQELDLVQSRVGALGHELRAAESQRGEFRREVAAQRRTTNEWWQWHLARLPRYTEELEGLHQAEAFASSLVAAVEEGQQRLRQGRLEQEEAQLELTRDRPGSERGDGGEVPATRRGVRAAAA